MSILCTEGFGETDYELGDGCINTAQLFCRMKPTFTFIKSISTMRDR